MTDPMDDRLRDHAECWNNAHPDSGVRAAVPTVRSKPRRTAPLIAAAAAAILVAGGAVLAAGHRVTPPTAGDTTPPVPSTTSLSAHTPSATTLSALTASAPPGSTNSPSPDSSTSSPVGTAMPSLARSTGADPLVDGSSGGLRPFTGEVSYPMPPSVPAGTRRCINADYVLESSRTAPSTDGIGWLDTFFTVRFVSRTPCEQPTLFFGSTLVDAAGRHLPIDTFPNGGPISRSLLVSPGQLLTGSVEWAVYQGRTQPPVRLDIDPGGDSSATPSISLSGIDIPPHPANTSNVNPWRATAIGRAGWVEEPGSLASLDAKITALTAVTLGQTISYSITLDNRTKTPVALAPCPGFVEQISVTPLKTTTTVGVRGALNCAGLPSRLDPGASVHLRFEADTAGQITGPGYLNWSLLDGAHVATSAGSTLMITG